MVKRKERNWEGNLIEFGDAVSSTSSTLTVNNENSKKAKAENECPCDLCDDSSSSVDNNEGLNLISNVASTASISDCMPSPKHNVVKKKTKKSRCDECSECPAKAGSSISSSSSPPLPAGPNASILRKLINWEIMFERLKEYKREHGDCRVPTNYDKNCQDLPSKLGNWVLVQSRDTLTKAAKGDDPLYQDRKNRLDAIGFEWTSIWHHKWDYMYERLEKFHAKHGHCRVPTHYDDGQEGPWLGHWVRRQQTEIPPRVKSGKKASIERKQRLDALDFEWDLVFDAKWQVMFERLRAFQKENGHCRVPLDRNKKTKPVMTSQEDDASTLNGSSTASVYDSDDDMATTTTTTDDTASVATSASPSKRSLLKPTNLGRWCQEQRKQILEKLKNKVEDDATTLVYRQRKEQLDAIGFEWTTANVLDTAKNLKWNAMFDKLVQFQKVYGHCRVSKTYNEDKDEAMITASTSSKSLVGALPRLSWWVRNQQILVPRHTNRGGEDVNPVYWERKKRLDEIGFEWNRGAVHSESWERMFQQLQDYKAQHGHTRVPYRNSSTSTSNTTTSSSSDQDPEEESRQTIALGIWVYAQRSRLPPKIKQGDALSKSRKAKLDTIGFEWDSVLNSKWDTMYQGLEKFEQKFGHARVPKSFQDPSLPGNLGSWVITQRRTLPVKAAKGDEEAKTKMTRLDKVGFQWEARNAKKKTPTKRAGNTKTA